jgi:hypothetical protein
MRLTNYSVKVWKFTGERWEQLVETRLLISGSSLVWQRPLCSQTRFESSKPTYHYLYLSRPIPIQRRASFRMPAARSESNPAVSNERHRLWVSTSDFLAI